VSDEISAHLSWVVSLFSGGRRDSAGGCALAQSLVESRDEIKVLLVERGTGETLTETETIVDAWDAIRSECAEVLQTTDGISIISGNCLGGATKFNLGMYVEETPEWIIENMGIGFASEEEIVSSYEWVSYDNAEEDCS